LIKQGFDGWRRRTQLRNTMHPAPHPTADAAPKKRDTLYLQVVVAIALGIFIGWLKPQWGIALQPLGDGFIKLIKMIIAPIIFCTVVAGIAGMGDLKRLGSVGLRALAYFLTLTTVALVIGLVVANVVRPGDGMHIDASKLDTKQVESYITQGKAQSTVGFFLNIIPKTFVSAFAEGEILQVLLLALLFGFALARIGEHGRPVMNLLNEVARVMFGIVWFITRLAPIGAFGAMAFTIGKFGIGSLVSLGQLLLTVYITCALFIVLVLGGVARAAGFRFWKVIRHIKEEIFIQLGTSSSEAAMPGLMEKLERVGCAKPVVGVVVPVLVQSRRHVHLPHVRRAFPRAGDRYADERDGSDRAARCDVAHLEGRGRHHRQRLYRAGGDDLDDGEHPARGARRDLWHRSVHVGNSRAHQSHRQRRRDPRDLEVGGSDRRIQGDGNPRGKKGLIVA